MKQYEALQWLIKDSWKDADRFVYATLTKPVTMRVWNGTHPQESNTRTHTAPVDTRVLVTMLSRFGDVGIRDSHLVPASHGYYARVAPESLKDWGLDP